MDLMEEGFGFRIEGGSTYSEEPDPAAEGLADLLSYYPVHERCREPVACELAESGSFLEFGKEGAPVYLLYQKGHGEHDLRPDFLHGGHESVRTRCLTQIRYAYAVEQKEYEPDCELVDMAHGEYRKGIPARMDPDEGCRADPCVPDDVPVGQHDGLGCPGGSACVDDGRHIVLRRTQHLQRCPVGIRWDDGPCVGPCHGCERGGHDACFRGNRRHVLHPDDLHIASGDLGSIGGIHYDKARSAVLQNGMHLMGAEIRKDGNCNSSCTVDGQIGKTPVGTALSEDRHPVALPDSPGMQVVCDVDALRQQLRVCDGVVPAPCLKCGHPAESFGRRLRHICQCQFPEFFHRALRIFFDILSKSVKLKIREKSLSDNSENTPSCGKMHDDY